MQRSYFYDQYYTTQGTPKQKLRPTLSFINNLFPFVH
jgi:hypothetical protein